MRDRTPEKDPKEGRTGKRDSHFQKKVTHETTKKKSPREGRRQPCSYSEIEKKRTLGKRRGPRGSLNRKKKQGGLQEGRQRPELGVKQHSIKQIQQTGTPSQARERKKTGKERRPGKQLSGGGGENEEIY